VTESPPPRGRRTARRAVLEARWAGFLALAALVMLTVAPGCLPGPVNLPGVGGDAYAQELARWTRNEEVYRRFEAKVFLTATYHSAAFREAYVQKRTAILWLRPQDRARLEQEEQRRSEHFYEFFVAIYTGARSWNDLERKESIWRVTLQGPRGERVQPAEIQRVDPQNAEIVAFYPYLDAFRQGYLFRFPRVAESGQPLLEGDLDAFWLSFSSPVAVAELAWGDAAAQARALPREARSDQPTSPAPAPPATTP